MRVICVTGSVGSGKTTLSRKLAEKLGLGYVDVKKVISSNKLGEKYDSKRKCKVVDVKKLNKSLIKLINKNNKKLKKIKGIVIDSHLSHYLPKRYVDLCVVTKCDIKRLNKRLKKRKYSKKKIEENVECEIFDVCLGEARGAGHKVIVIDTTKGINISEISKKVVNKPIRGS